MHVAGPIIATDYCNALAVSCGLPEVIRSEQLHRNAYVPIWRGDPAWGRRSTGIAMRSGYPQMENADTMPHGRPRPGGDLARARPVDRDRGLHSLLSPAAASAADAASRWPTSAPIAALPSSWSRTTLRGARAFRLQRILLAAGKFPGLCVVEPRQGNCHAINAAFETALATFPAATSFLMIDDDEIASPDWLERMVSRGRDHRRRYRRRAGLPDFDDERKRGLRRHPAFAPAYDAVGPGAGDLWLRQLPDHGGRCSSGSPIPAFDLRFNFLGGGDTDFFCRCRRPACGFTGSRKPSSPKPCRRAGPIRAGSSLRGLRIGAINYHVQRKAARTAWSRARLTLKMLAMLPLSLFHAGRLVADGAQGAHRACIR